MPRQRPATSGYARLAQADQEEGELSPDLSDDEDLNHSNPLTTRYESILPPGPRDTMRTFSSSSASKRRPRPRRRMRSNSSGIDIKAINARLEKWADEIASKFKISGNKGKSDEEEHLEIHHSVFQAPDGVRPYTLKQLELLPKDGPDRITKEQFDEVVESVRVAIEMGVHPKMISQGSSGSYFARNADGKVVGVFKPKDEEPYASRNPKWTKWIHRNLFPCFFGRACLIPNLSYVSEAAAYVLDSQLRTNLVPYTDVVYLSSKSFYYDFWDRHTVWRKKSSLPAKVGSFQYFLKGYKDANIFLRENPWPDQNTNDFRPDLEHKHKRRPLAKCMPNGAVSDDEDGPARVTSPPVEDTPRFSWTSNIKQAFREELEKLVILDYIMRNTDRGLDNWMIKIDWKSEEVSIVAEPPRERQNESLAPGPRPVSLSPQRPESNTSRPYKRYEAMESRSSTPLANSTSSVSSPSIKIGAIDNSLSWPWKHPDAWRSFPFGWLFLPVSLIGQPFSAKTRAHFLPLLTSTAWWSETQVRLRRIFAQDNDFQESMFARQIAVMKGQAWNVVETLKQPDHGPLELTRRTRVCVWDDLVDVPVAIPMRSSSPDASRGGKKQVRIDDQEEEIDIGVNHASAPATKMPTHGALPSFDLLGSPTSELPNPKRFELTRETSDADIGRSSADYLGSLPSGPPSPDLTQRDRADGSSAFDFASREAHERLSNSLTLPDRPPRRNKSRFSLELPRGLSQTTSATNANANASSSSTLSGRRRANSTRTPGAKGGSSKFIEYNEFDDDESAGDLGYSAATGMERLRRKVIVERLEAVKSRRPVFTWC